ncbi:hypothetical protein JF66_00675 [Cryobacterium sp. MLB-32]|uniref:hypothetical protein n=1 Tax=Cryobacterium sp. MLB-32 TaxID=1529318 RepID=UPI0004E6BD97|nr:hypothetical protein [Cryobacterium sp. MLB-32]KFF61017.1 hypothetical protein JF66_00675 [Cryobacterium sp. MLB-32]
MSAGWIAASVRARSMAERRVGAGLCHTISMHTSPAPALALLSGTMYGERLAACTSPVEYERATQNTVLWQLRVLAGWLPASGTRLVRALAAGFERDNILALEGTFTSAAETPEYFDLGVLSTAWPRLRNAQSTAQLRDGLRLTPWGDAGTDGQTSLADVLTVTWLSRLASAAPASRPWAQMAVGLCGARMVLVDRSVPSSRFRHWVRPLLGTAWESATTMADMKVALPPTARKLLDGLDHPDELWRAEVRCRLRMEDDAFRMLRVSPAGPDTVLASLTVLQSDSWRLRAALFAADRGAGSSEVLNAVA